MGSLSQSLAGSSESCKPLVEWTKSVRCHFWYLRFFAEMGQRSVHGIPYLFRRSAESTTPDLLQRMSEVSVSGMTGVPHRKSANALASQKTFSVRLVLWLFSDY